jgi:hypothetical protein
MGPKRLRPSFETRKSALLRMTGSGCCEGWWARIGRAFNRNRHVLAFDYRKAKLLFN